MKLYLKDLITFCKKQGSLYLETTTQRGYDFCVFDANYDKCIGLIDYDTFQSMDSSFKMVSHFGGMCKVILK